MTADRIRDRDPDGEVEGRTLISGADEGRDVVDEDDFRIDGLHELVDLEPPMRHSDVRNMICQILTVRREDGEDLPCRFPFGKQPEPFLHCRSLHFTVEIEHGDGFIRLVVETLHRSPAPRRRKDRRRSCQCRDQQRPC